MGSHSLLHGIFLTQGLPHRRQILYHLSHQGSATPLPLPSPHKAVVMDYPFQRCLCFRRNPQERVLLNPKEGLPTEVAKQYKDAPANAGTAREAQVRSLSQDDSLEKEMATHSSIPAWKIPWTEEPGGLQSTGLQKSQKRLSD